MIPATTPRLMSEIIAEERAASATCLRCIKARAEVVRQGCTPSSRPDHGDAGPCWSHSVELCGPATFGAARVSVQIH